MISLYLIDIPENLLEMSFEEQKPQTPVEEYREVQYAPQEPVIPMTSQDAMNLMSSDSPLKSAIRANSSYKIREFEWFEVETKIRLFVQKLMEPTLKQIYEDRKVVDQVQWTIKLNNDSVDMLKDVVLNQGVGIPIFEEFHKRIYETELKGEQERRKNTQDISRLESQIERISFESKQLTEACRQMEQTKLQLLDDFTDVKKQNIEFREQITNALQNLSAELTANFTWARQQMQRFEEKFHHNDLTLQDHQNQINNCEKKIQDLRQQSLEFTQKHQGHLTRFERMDLNIQTLFETMNLTKKLTTQVQNLQNSISTLDNYVSTYQPLYIQGQISESLFHCLPQHQLNKLAMYESRRFEEIHKQIIGDEGVGKVAQKINEYTIFMEGVTRRNSKLIQQQKVKKANNISQNTEDRDHFKSHESFDPNNIDESAEDSQSEMSSSVTFQKVEASKQTKQQHQKKGTGSMTGAEAQHYEDMITSVRSQIADETKEFKSKIELTVKDVYAQIKELDEQLFMHNMQGQEDLERRQHQGQAQIQSLRDTFGELAGSFQSVQQSQTAIHTHLKQIETVVQSVLHYMVLLTHLLIQDEIDRQGIALMGVKDTNIDDLGGQLPSINRKVQAGNRVLQVKPDCLSCSSHPLTTVTAFKLACLAYNPSDISVDGKVFKRDQLLEICTKVLWAARKEMNEASVQQPVQEHQIVRKSSSKRMGNLSVDSRAAPLTNAHLQHNLSGNQQPNSSPSHTETPSSNIASKLYNVSRVNMVNLKVDLPQQGPVSKRTQVAYRTQKRLFNLHQNLHQTDLQ